MRRFRAFVFLAGQQLKQPWFWVFLILFVLVGPFFVILHSETNLAEREMRPLLSESATVDHFDAGAFSPMIYGRESAILLFRNPNAESASAFPISPAFATGWQLQPSARWTPYFTWSSYVNGSLSDFYRNLLPIFMIVVGILTVPSRRRLAALRIVSPCGRWGCFVMIAGVLALQVVLLSVLAGASTGLALAITQGVGLGAIWFIAGYFGALVIYGLGFALLGLVIAELVRNRPVAMLIGLILMFGVWEYVSPIPARLYTSLIQSVTGRTLQEPNQNPVFEYIRLVLRPPQSTIDSISLMSQTLASAVEDSYTPRSTVLRELAQLWASLLAFAGVWFAISWVAFPRTLWKTS